MMHLRLPLLSMAAMFLLSPTPSAQAEPSEAEARAYEIALVNRITWGATPADLARIHELGAARYLQAQLHPDSGPKLPPAVQRRIDDLSISQQSDQQAHAQQRTMRNQAKNQVPEARQATYREVLRISRQRALETTSRSVWRSLYSQNQLQEHMTWFWLNHFNVYASKADIGTYISQYEDGAIRPHALGKFRDLLAATVRSPAMLAYLDNPQNIVGSINENYARELMELHTLGVKGGYTQTDVQELARILTGLGVRNKDTPPKVKPELRSQLVVDGLFIFNPERHDYGHKRFLEKDIPGSGMSEIDQAVDLLARHPATAKFISTKLAIYFVGDAPSAELIKKMSNTFQSSDGDIASTLQTLFGSPEFARSLKTGIFKDPVHYVFSSLRLSYATLPPIIDPKPAVGMLQQLGQGLYKRLTPDGYPQAASDWSGPGQMTARFEAARTIISMPQVFYRDGAMEPVEFAKIPDLYRSNLENGLFSALSTATRQTLEQAKSRKDVNTYLLASPEFMRR